MKQNKSIHADHRKRVKARFMEYGFSGFEDHEILEMLLYYALPRKDTNIIGHKLIENKIDVARRLDYLILEANSKNEILRKKISDLKFEIIDEDIVYDKKKYYQIMKIRYNEEAPKLSQVEILLGPILIKKHNQIFIDYLHNQLQTIHAIMEKNQVLSEKLNNKKTIMEEILNETI